MEYKTLNITTKNNYEIVTFDSNKVCAINMEMIGELDHYFSNFSDKDANGVILTGKGEIFSVGLDMKQLIMLDDEGIGKFFEAFFSLVQTMTSFKYPVVSAINGHSPAGGCVLAIASDYRVMAENEKYKIGLNELPVGIMATPAIFHLYSFWIGQKNAYQNLLTGRLLNPHEAKKQDLVDEIVPLDQVMMTAERKMQEYLSYDLATWTGMKTNYRMKLIELMKEDHKNGHLSTIEHFKKNDGRQYLMDALANLRK